MVHSLRKNNWGICQEKSLPIPFNVQCYAQRLPPELCVGYLLEINWMILNDWTWSIMNWDILRWWTLRYAESITLGLERLAQWYLTDELRLVWRQEVPSAPEKAQEAVLFKFGFASFCLPETWFTVSPSFHHFCILLSGLFSNFSRFQVVFERESITQVIQHEKKHQLQLSSRTCSAWKMPSPNGAIWFPSSNLRYPPCSDWSCLAADVASQSLKATSWKCLK